MLSDAETIKWLLENRINKSGEVDLCCLNFPAGGFDGNVNISRMTVAGDLNQSHQYVNGCLMQDKQNVDGDLYQNKNVVTGVLFQNTQIVGKSLYQNSCIVKGDLYQDNQTVDGWLTQYSQKVKKQLFSHKLEDDEEWKVVGCYVARVKKLKRVTKAQLLELGFELVDDIDDTK